MRRLYNIPLLLMTCLASSIYAQQLPQVSSSPETKPEFLNFTYQVKHIEDFMSRFNGDTYVIDSTETEGWKRQNVLFLFDEETYYANEALADSLIQMQLDSAVRLEYAAQNWTAVAECNVVYKGEKMKIQLTLKTEKVEEFIYKWVIIDATGEILTLNPAKRNPGLSISPTDNEVGFVSLAHITSAEAINILNYTEKDYMPDGLSVFYTLVYTKQLKIESVQEVFYDFYDIHGFDFRVQRHLEDKAHSGWLITNIRKHE